MEGGLQDWRRPDHATQGGHRPQDPAGERPVDIRRVRLPEAAAPEGKGFSTGLTPGNPPAPAGGRQARASGQCPDLTRVKSTRKQMRRHETQRGQADVTLRTSRTGPRPRLRPSRSCRAAGGCRSHSGRGWGRNARGPESKRPVDVCRVRMPKGVSPQARGSPLAQTFGNPPAPAWAGAGTRLPGAGRRGWI